MGVELSRYCAESCVFVRRWGVSRLLIIVIGATSVIMVMDDYG